MIDGDRSRSVRFVGVFRVRFYFYFLGVLAERKRIGGIIDSPRTLL